MVAEIRSEFHILDDILKPGETAVYFRHAPVPGEERVIVRVQDRKQVRVICIEPLSTRTNAFVTTRVCGNDGVPIDMAENWHIVRPI